MSQITKCLYFENHYTASVLMIDDIAPIAISENERIGPDNDWGYLLDSENSLFSFFKKHILSRFPDVKGTFFIPLDSQSYLDKNSTYNIFTKDTNGEFSEFINSLHDSFEAAFHGIKHTYYSNNELIIEYENFKPNEEAFQENSFSSIPLTKNFLGGKFPAYKYNLEAIRYIEKKKFKWMAFDSYMINKKSENSIHYKSNFNLIDIPTNISGDIFDIYSRKRLKTLIKWLFGKSSFLSASHNLKYLYKNRLPITIQEHFQNQREDGKRQHPNIFDDIHSLRKIYSILEKLDIWFTNCTDLAHYFDSYKKVQINRNNDNLYIEYNGLWEQPIISFITDFPCLVQLKTGNRLIGAKTKEGFLFNVFEKGDYIICQ